MSVVESISALDEPRRKRANTQSEAADTSTPVPGECLGSCLARPCCKTQWSVQAKKTLIRVRSCWVCSRGFSELMRLSPARFSTNDTVDAHRRWPRANETNREDDNEQILLRTAVRITETALCVQGRLGSRGSRDSRQTGDSVALWLICPLVVVHGDSIPVNLRQTDLRSLTMSTTIEEFGESVCSCDWSSGDAAELEVARTNRRSIPPPSRFVAAIGVRSLSRRT